MGDHSAFEFVPDALLVVGRDGSIVFANRHAERLFGYEPGQLVVAVVRDITSLVKIRRSLAATEAEVNDLNQTFGNTPIGLCSFDKELRYLRISNWLAKINGVSVKEHIGRKIGEVIPDLAIGVEPKLRQVLQTGESIINGKADYEPRGQGSGATSCDAWAASNWRIAVRRARSTSAQ